MEPNNKRESDTRAIGYIRVSTENQVKEGASLDAQQAKIRQWAELNGYDVAAIYSDPGISGKEMRNREGLQKALEDMGEGDALVVHSLSRLTRSTRHTLDIAELLDRKKADLVSISEKIETNTAAGKMVFRMLAVLNEFERDLTSERIRQVLRYKKSKGERTGHVPYGFTVEEDGKVLVEDPVEQSILGVIHRLRGQGLSLRQIAEKLNETGILNRGQTWSHMAVKRVAKL